MDPTTIVFLIFALAYTYGTYAAKQRNYRLPYILLLIGTIITWVMFLWDTPQETKGFALNGIFFMLSQVFIVWPMVIIGVIVWITQSWRRKREKS
ncbi:hypothetical protein [Paenibacillus abyssi]|uniref:Uncharacterized protein n=1 Tax=Paenibacillus abyssi TaxID=1340531 RepID=A0A917G1A1_9BACL|nr:hypothetical protein [Paenibacillus abyssi]GGG17823.1 hypothetical protein GCM10010916_38280 [Paenibacillus abyssi]